MYAISMTVTFQLMVCAAHIVGYYISNCFYYSDTAHKLADYIIVNTMSAQTIIPAQTNMPDLATTIAGKYSDELFNRNQQKHTEC